MWGWFITTHKEHISLHRHQANPHRTSQRVARRKDGGWIPQWILEKCKRMEILVLYVARKCTFTLYYIYEFMMNMVIIRWIWAGYKCEFFYFMWRGRLCSGLFIGRITNMSLGFSSCFVRKFEVDLYICFISLRGLVIGHIRVFF